MARKEKNAGIQKKLPTKNEVKGINKKLYDLSKTDFSAASIKTANAVYSMNNEIVEESTFKKTKTVSPSCKSIELEGELQFPCG